VDGALADVEKGVARLEKEGQTERALGGILLAAETCWGTRRVDEARRWVDRGIDVAQNVGDSEHLTRLLALGATAANLRGEYQRAASFQAEIERRAPTEKAAEEELPSGGTLLAPLANPVSQVEPALAQTTEE